MYEDQKLTAKLEDPALRENRGMPPMILSEGVQVETEVPMELALDGLLRKIGHLEHIVSVLESRLHSVCGSFSESTDNDNKPSRSYGSSPIVQTVTEATNLIETLCNQMYALVSRLEV